MGSKLVHIVARGVFIKNFAMVACCHIMKGRFLLPQTVPVPQPLLASPTACQNSPLCKHNLPLSAAYVSEHTRTTSEIKIFLPCVCGVV